MDAQTYERTSTQVHERMRECMRMYELPRTHNVHMHIRIHEHLLKVTQLLQSGSKLVEGGYRHFLRRLGAAWSSRLQLDCSEEVPESKAILLSLALHLSQLESSPCLDISCVLI